MMDYLMGLRILLVTHYLIRNILVEMVLDVHLRGVKINVFRSRYCYDTSYIFYKKKVHGKILVLVCT